MSKILFVNACVRPNSRTLDLAKYVISKLSGEIEEVKLYNEKLSPLSLEEMTIRDESAKSKAFTSSVFNYAKQFAAADTIVVAAPYWDLMFPAVLKNYFENNNLVNGNVLTNKKPLGFPSGLL